MDLDGDQKCCRENGCDMCGMWRSRVSHHTNHKGDRLVVGAPSVCVIALTSIKQN